MRLLVVERWVGGVTGAGGMRMTGLRVGNPSRWVVMHGIVGRASGGVTETHNHDEHEPDEKFKEEVVNWLNDVVTKLENNSVGGWVKTKSAQESRCLRVRRPE